MDKVTLAYLAGFIDADGSITIVIGRCKDKKTGIVRVQYRARLSACNCKLEPIQLLQDTFGSGKTRMRHWKGTSKVKWRPNYEWIVSNRVATKALIQLLPFLLIKRQQAEHCLEMQALKDSNSAAARRWNPALKNACIEKCEELKQKCNILNKRGL